MDNILTDFDNNYDSVIKELAKEGVILDKTIKKLQRAKKKVSAEGILQGAIENKIKK